MPCCLSLVANSGRIFTQMPPKIESDGLVASIDFQTKNRSYFPTQVRFNFTGEQLMVADSRGQVTLLEIAANRFHVVASHLKEAPVQVTFTGRQNPSDQILICLKDQHKAIVNALNGKQLQQIQLNLHHQMQIRATDTNTQQSRLLTLSNDTCALWSTSTGQTILKTRTLQAQQGCHFHDARFSPCGTKVVTLFKDGSLVFWSLDAIENGSQSVRGMPQDPVSKLELPLEVSLIEVGPGFVVGAGPSCPFIVIKDMGFGQDEHYYKLPNKARGVEQLQLLRDKYLLAYVSEGIFYLVDINPENRVNQIKISLELRIPGHKITRFDIDSNMQKVALATAGGSCLLYDLAKALENEALIAKKRIEMGVEPATVYTYLTQALEEELCSSRPILQSSGSNMNANTASKVPRSQFMNQSAVNLNVTRGLTEEKVLHKVQSHFSPVLGRCEPEILQTQCLQRTQRDSHHDFVEGSELYQQPTGHNPFMTVQDGKELEDSVSAASLGQPRFLQKNNSSVVSNQRLRPLNAKQEHLIHGVSTALLTQKKTFTSKPESTKNFNHSIDQNYQPQYSVCDQSIFGKTQSEMFTNVKLRKMLRQFGEFPQKYRNLTWKNLLQLPLNKQAFQALVNRGVHPAFKSLHKRFPVDSYRLYNKLVRILSAIGYWSPIFLEIEYLPQIVFPFLKIIPNDDLFVFELLMVLITQWMQVWFEAYPAEPQPIMTAIQDVLHREDPALLSHLSQCGFSPQAYAWPLLKSFFTETFDKDEWQKFIDHLFVNADSPEYLLYFLASFLLTSRGSLLQCSCIEDLHAFLSRPSTTPVKKLSPLASSLKKKYSTTIYSGNFAQGLPLQSSGDCYVPFVRYPDHFVTFQNKLRDKIIEEEAECERKQELLVELREKASEVNMKEEQLRLQQEAMFRAEVERKARLRMEVEAQMQAKIRMDEMTRVARLDHIKAIESTIQSSLHNQERLREEEYKVLGEEISAKAREQKYEFDARMQDEMIANLEFKANRKLLEHLQTRQQEDSIKNTKEELSQLQAEQSHRDRLLKEEWQAQDQQSRLNNEVLRHQLAMQAQSLKSENEKQMLEAQVKEAQRMKEEQLMQLEQARSQRQTQEQALLQQQQSLDLLQKQNIYEQSQKSRRMQEEQSAIKRMEDQKIHNTNLIRLEEEKRLLQSQMLGEQMDRERLANLEKDRRMEDEHEAIAAAQQNEAIRMQMAAERQQEIENMRHFQDQERMQQEQHENEARARENAYQQNEQRALQREQERIEQDRKEIEGRRAQMQALEKEEHERRDFVQMLRSTEQNINQICDKGEEQLAQQKALRSLQVSPSIQSSSLGQESPAIVRQPQQEQYQREEQLRRANQTLKEELSQKYLVERQMQEQQQEHIKENMQTYNNKLPDNSYYQTESHANDSAVHPAPYLANYISDSDDYSSEQDSSYLSQTSYAESSLKKSQRHAGNVRSNNVKNQSPKFHQQPPMPYPKSSQRQTEATPGAGAEQSSAPTSTQNRVFSYSPIVQQPVFQGQEPSALLYPQMQTQQSVMRNQPETTEGTISESSSSMLTSSPSQAASQRAPLRNVQHQTSGGQVYHNQHIPEETSQMSSSGLGDSSSMLTSSMNSTAQKQ